MERLEEFVKSISDSDDSYEFVKLGVEDVLSNSIPLIPDAEVVMWLYDSHKIWIVVFPTEQDWTFDIFKGLDCVKSESFFNTPANAYEAAIEYTLKNLV